MTEHHLTRCELEVMDVVWHRSPVTVQDVCDVDERGLAYTTIMTTLRILEDKGVVQRCGKRGRAILYKPRVSRELVRRCMSDALTQRLFDGSAKSLLLSLVDSGSLSQQDVRELKQAIQALESDR